jgi:uncharacterized membrane protein YdfJ with MMPL/SSD domain
MIVVGIILTVLGLLLPSLFPTFGYAQTALIIGIILLVVGLILALMERTGLDSTIRTRSRRGPSLRSATTSRRLSPRDSDLLRPTQRTWERADKLDAAAQTSETPQSATQNT